MADIALPGTLAAATAAELPAATDLILSELRGAVASVDPAALEHAIALLLGAERILAAGAGRSRLALAMGAMRLMPLGLAIHVAGEVTAPPRSAPGRCCWRRPAPARRGLASRQYGGSLFEQAVLLTLDAICHALWRASGVEASALWARHANIE